LAKVVVEGEGRADSALFHDHKRDAIGQRIRLVVVLLKAGPTLVKQRPIHFNDFDKLAVQQPIANINRSRMLAADIEKCYDLIKDERRCYELQPARYGQPPVCGSGNMVLIAGNLQRDYVSRVEKGYPHG
jgi:hypothetical protein